MYWPEEDQALIETLNNVISINKKPMNICVDGSCLVDCSV
jgi:hypothetical protein